MVFERGEDASGFADAGGSFGAEAFAGFFKEGIDVVFAVDDDFV